LGKVPVEDANGKSQKKPLSFAEKSGTEARCLGGRRHQLKYMKASRPVEPQGAGAKKLGRAHPGKNTGTEETLSL